MIRLTYFDFPGGRGEDCRIALHMAGVDFEDDRIKGKDWPALKPTTPFGALPVLSLDGKALGQSNAILRYIGSQYGLHPSDPWEAARHDAILNAVEDLRKQLDGTIRLPDDEKKAVRERLAAGPIPDWGARMEAQIRGPFVSGDTLQVADLKVFVAMKWFLSGTVDHVPADIFAPQKRLTGLYEAVQSHQGVKSWYERG